MQGLLLLKKFFSSNQQFLNWSPESPLKVLGVMCWLEGSSDYALDKEGFILLC